MKKIMLLAWVILVIITSNVFAGEEIIEGETLKIELDEKDCKYIFISGVTPPTKQVKIRWVDEKGQEHETIAGTITGPDCGMPPKANEINANWIKLNADDIE